MSPEGVWIDGKGRGAIEIKPCDGNQLCGRIVWVRDKSEVHGCGRMLLGHVRAVGGGEWDHGWIIDPDTRSKYDVAIKRLSGSKLKVTGYMGSRLFSRDIIWHRAPRGLKRCDAPEVDADAQVAQAGPGAAPVSVVYNSPKSAPMPVRNPITTDFADYEIRPPQPIPAVRPRPAEFAGIMMAGGPEPELSLAAREAQALLSVPAPGLVAAPAEAQRVVSVRKCTIQAPFVSFDYPCRR